MVRREVAELVSLGPFPASEDVTMEIIQSQESLLNSIARPVTDEEALQLIKLFGPDDYYGMAWTLVHLIESSPNWPLTDCLTGDSNEWIEHLKKRFANAEKSEDNTN